MRTPGLEEDFLGNLEEGTHNDVEDAKLTAKQNRVQHDMQASSS